MKLSKILSTWLAFSIGHIAYGLIIYGRNDGITVKIRDGLIVWTQNAPINLDVVFFTLVFALVIWYQNRNKGE